MEEDKETVEILLNEGDMSFSECINLFFNLNDVYLIMKESGFRFDMETLSRISAEVCGKSLIKDPKIDYVLEKRVLDSTPSPKCVKQDELSNIYMIGRGKGLELKMNGAADIVEVRDSPFEQLSGTPFSNSKRVLANKLLTKSVAREEVYAAIEKFAKPEMVNEIKAAINKKYPPNLEWGDHVPRMESVMFLYNEYLRDNNTWKG
jgi:hypothetical protein